MKETSRGKCETGKEESFR